MPSQNLIEMRHVNVKRGQKWVLQDISLTIGPQNFITLIGPNGAGKSTLLHCLLGLHSPDSGVIERAARIKIGYMPQRLSMTAVMPLSVLRFITLRKKYDAASLERAVHETDTAAVLHRPLSGLSSGEMQRVLLARSLLDAPQLLVLDEPTQNLDITGQLNFYKLLNSIYAERGLSVLMVSHDLHMVMASSDQVICLYHHICCSGAPQKVARDPQFGALFGQDMAHMMAVYQHSHSHSHD